MGLDACVYCTCFETSRLRTPPRAEWGVYVDEDGARTPTTRDLDESMEFDAWNYLDACEHEGGVLLHHRLGNMALIGLYRSRLAPYADALPIIVTKVIYNGIHAGDRLSLEQVERLAAELDVMAGIRDPDLRQFEQQLHELVACARSVRRPIVF